MAELVLAVVGVAIPIADNLFKLSKLVKRVKNAPLSVQNIHTGLMSLSWVIEDLGTAMDQTSSYLSEAHAQDKREEYDSFLRRFERVSTGINWLNPFVKDIVSQQDKPLLQYWMRLLWALNKSRTDETWRVILFLLFESSLFRTSLLIQELRYEIRKLRKEVRSAPPKLYARFERLQMRAKQEIKAAADARKHLENLVHFPSNHDSASLSRRDIRSLGLSIEREAIHIVKKAKIETAKSRPAAEERASSSRQKYGRYDSRPKPTAAHIANEAKAERSKARAARENRVSSSWQQHGPHNYRSNSTTVSSRKSVTTVPSIDETSSATESQAQSPVELSSEEWSVLSMKTSPLFVQPISSKRFLPPSKSSSSTLSRFSGSWHRSPSNDSAASEADLGPVTKSASNVYRARIRDDGGNLWEDYSPWPESVLDSISQPAKSHTPSEHKSVGHGDRKSNEPPLALGRSDNGSNSKVQSKTEGSERSKNQNDSLGRARRRRLKSAGAVAMAPFDDDDLESQPTSGTDYGGE